MMALRRAVQICGGIDALGDRLNVSTKTLEQIVGLLLEATATRQGKQTPDFNEGGRRGPRQ